MDKIMEWNEKFIIYSFDNSEPIFDDYFKAFSLNGEFIKPKTITMSYDKCEVSFEEEFNVVVVNKVFFNRPNSDIQEEVLPREESRVEPPIDEDFQLDEGELEDVWATVNYSKIGNSIFANNLIGEPFRIKAFKRVFFKEAYPDFAAVEEFVDINIPVGQNVIFESVKNKVVEVTLDKVYTLEYRGVYYFTTVSALKEAFVDTGLKLPNKTDEKLKRLIMEKSLYLKKRFGLTEEQTEDYEMYPSFKRLTTLYCIQELIAYAFIQGENSDNGSSNGSNNGASNVDLKLGKFSTSSPDENNSGSGFLPDLVTAQIKTAEEDVRNSIFIKSDKVYWFKKQGGVYDENQKQC